MCPTQDTHAGVLAKMLLGTQHLGRGSASSDFSFLTRHTLGSRGDGSQLLSDLPYAPQFYFSALQIKKRNVCGKVKLKVRFMLVQKFKIIKSVVARGAGEWEKLEGRSRKELWGVKATFTVVG